MIAFTSVEEYNATFKLADDEPHVCDMCGEPSDTPLCSADCFEDMLNEADELEAEMVQMELAELQRPAETTGADPIFSGDK